MMKIFLFASAILFLLPCTAQKKDTAFATATLLKATVYYGYGAELQHSAKVPLINGLQQVVIDGIALAPDVSTLQIGCAENITILSYYHRVFVKKTVPVKELFTKSHDTIKQLQKQLAVISSDLNINEDVLRRISSLIEKNFVTESKREISSAELIKLSEYYSAKVKQLKEKQFELLLIRDELTTRINTINERINAITPGTEPIMPKPSGQLVLQVMVKGAGSEEFSMAYFTRNAGWIPTYELRMKTIDNTFKLVYKASVTQSTGLDWEKVKLSLSTSNPNQGTTLPLLSPAYLLLYVPELYNSMKSESSKDMAYKLKTLQPTQITSDSYGNQQHTIEEKSNVEAYTITKESLLNINFEIDLPYDIPSDGKSYTVAIKEEKIPAFFKHYAIPKLDKDAFLVAEITRWDSLGLLPGEASIIMDNVYLGKSFIDPNATTDTLSLSLGRDKRIAINRTLVKELKTSKEKSDFKTEQFTYEITVKNNKKQAVSLLLKDQYPISKIKEVEITLSGTDAEKNTETGILSWNIKLNPGESKKLRFSYSVKYPKDKVLMAH